MGLRSPAALPRPSRPAGALRSAGHPRRLTRLRDHLKKGPQAAPVRLVPAGGRHRSPGHGPALVRAARRPRPAADRGACPRDPVRPPRRQPGGPGGAGSRPAGPAGHFGPNGCAPALVHPRRRRPAPRHRRPQGHPKPALPPGRGSRAPEDHHPGHPRAPAAPTPACWRTSSSRTWTASHPWPTWRQRRMGRSPKPRWRQLMSLSRSIDSGRRPNRGRPPPVSAAFYAANCMSERSNPGSDR